MLTSSPKESSKQFIDRFRRSARSSRKRLSPQNTLCRIHVLHGARSSVTSQPDDGELNSEKSRFCQAPGAGRGVSFPITRLWSIQNQYVIIRTARIVPYRLEQNRSRVCGKRIRRSYRKDK